MGWLDVDLGHFNKDGRHGELWGYLLMQMGWALNSKPSPRPSWAILKAAISSWASPSKGAFHHRRHDEEGSCGSAMKRGAVAVVWWRPEGVAAVVAGAGARIDGAGGGGLATSRRCYRFGERKEWRLHACMEGREALQASDKRASDEDGGSDGGYEEEDGGGSLHVWTPCV